MAFFPLHGDSIPSSTPFLSPKSLRPVQAQAGFTVMPNYAFADAPDMDAFLILVFRN